MVRSSWAKAVLEGQVWGKKRLVEARGPQSQSPRIGETCALRVPSGARSRASPACVHSCDTKTQGAIRFSSARAQSHPGLRPPVSSQGRTGYTNPLHAEETSSQMRRWEAPRSLEGTSADPQWICSLLSLSEHYKGD